MLIRFNVKNFLSFAPHLDKKTGQLLSQEFSMLPGAVRNKPEHIYESSSQNLLRFAALYGANAGGKSNLIKALAFVQDTVRRGKIPANSSMMYTRTKPENKHIPSYFSLQILLGEHCYEYGFEVLLATGEFVSEWLYEIKNDNEKCLFEKNETNPEYQFAGPLKGINNLHIYAKDIARSNVLFLSTMNKNKKAFYQNNRQAYIIRKIYKWIRDSLVITFPYQPVREFAYFHNSENIDKLAALLKAFGTGIEQLDPQPITFEKMYAQFSPKFAELVKKDVERERKFCAKRIQNMHNLHSHAESVAESPRSKKIQDRPKGWFGWARYNGQFFIITILITKELTIEEKVSLIKIKHKNSEELFDYDEESDGTIRLFELIEILISDKPKVYVIDELDRCLHPNLICKFVEAFFDNAKVRKSQLLVTTHESRLLDLELLRRDEVWFVDKNKNGESSLYSLEEYNERFDKKIDRAYLDGRYGGVPILSKLFPLSEE